MKTYKTPEGIRARALRYYYEHREEVREYQAAYRRAHGSQVRRTGAEVVSQRETWRREHVSLRKPKQTREQKLAAHRVCACGRQITTPTLLLNCSRKCLRCANPPKFTTEGYRLSSQKYRASATNGFGKFQAWKAKQVCKDCGVPWTKDQRLDFHHRDPATKKFRISRGVHRVSAARLWAEIAKCDLLCRACHEGTHGYKIFTQRSRQ